MVTRFAWAVCLVGLLAVPGPSASAIESGAPFRDATASVQRLKKLRAKATEPNIWHENVEWVVWRSVGLETVQYVRNVHRYYIAFKDMAEANAVRRALISEATGK